MKGYFNAKAKLVLYFNKYYMYVSVEQVWLLWYVQP